MAAQNKEVIIKGKVLDSSNSKGLEGATIFIENINIGTISGANGEFKIQLPLGKSTFIISYVGFITLKEEINIVNDLKHNFILQDNIEIGRAHV